MQQIPPEGTGVALDYRPVDYYQIYEDGRQLAGMAFVTRKEARRRLRGLVHELQYMARGWYAVQPRLPHLPVGNALGVTRCYGDGSVVKVTYTVRKVSVNAAVPVLPPAPSAGLSPRGDAVTADGGLLGGGNVLY